VLTRRNLPLAVVLLAVLVQGVLLVVFASRLYFFGGDDWDFLLFRGTIPGVNRGWFVPHYDHWSTAAIAIYRVLFHFFGLRHYLPYGLVVIVFHLTACLLLYALLRRAGSGAWAAAAATVVGVFLGAGAQAILWDVELTLLGSLVCGFAALLVLQGGADAGRLRVVWGLLVLALSFSGLGITVIGCAALFVLLRSGWREALAVASVPTLVFAVWFVWIGHTGADAGQSSAWELTQVPSQVWLVITSALESTSAIPGTGGVLLLVLVAGTTLSHETPRPLRDLALAGIGASLFQTFLTALVRPGIASTGRYTYLVVIFLLPAVAVCLAALARRTPEPRWLVGLLGGVLVLGVAANGVYLEHKYYSATRSYTDAWPGTIRGIVAASADRQRVLTENPEEWFSEGFSPSLVASEAIRDKLPPGHATAAERLEAERQFYVGVSDEPFSLMSGGEVSLLYFLDPIQDGEGCGTYRAAADAGVITVDVGSADNEVAVRSDSTSVRTYLVRDGRESDERTWSVDPDDTTYVASTAKGAQLVMVFNRGGTYTVCRG
jgi:hypothetical protein